MLGYYKEPELTREAFTDDGWLHTGDKGALDAEGNLKITGRVKDLFKTSKGKYVAPGADRGQARHARRHRGLLRDRRQPGPAAGAGHAQPRRHPQAAASAGRAGARSVAGRAPEEPSTRRSTRTSSSTAWS
jgi:hypothetical protein